MTIANYAELAILNAVGNATAYSITTPYIKLHTGDPGEDGTANAATETTRKAASFAAAASGAIASDAAISWPSVAATETYTYWSLWDASTGGNCHWTGALAAGNGVSNAVTAGDTFTIASGALTLTLD